NDFGVVKRIPGAPTPPALKDCDNPTITGHSKGDAPAPPNGGTQGQNTGTSTGNGSNGSGSGSGSGTDPAPGTLGSEPTPIGVAQTAEAIHARQVAVQHAVGGVRSSSRVPPR